MTLPSALQGTLIVRPSPKTLPVQSRLERDLANEVRTKAYDLIWDNLPDIVQALIDSALGLHVQEIDPLSGQINRYTQPPDIKAAKWLAERVLGSTPRPTEPSREEDRFEDLVRRRARHKLAEKVADKLVEPFQTQEDTVSYTPETDQKAAIRAYIGGSGGRQSPT